MGGFGGTTDLSDKYVQMILQRTMYLNSSQRASAVALCVAALNLLRV